MWCRYDTNTNHLPISKATPHCKISDRADDTNPHSKADSDQHSLAVGRCITFVHGFLLYDVYGIEEILPLGKGRTSKVETLSVMRMLRGDGGGFTIRKHVHIDYFFYILITSNVVLSMNVSCVWIFFNVSTFKRIVFKTFRKSVLRGLTKTLIYPSRKANVHPYWYNSHRYDDVTGPEIPKGQSKQDLPLLLLLLFSLFLSRKGAANNSSSSSLLSYWADILIPEE